MDVVRTIAPGKRGSIRFLKEWGDQLVNVRYRKDLENKQMLTTIEIVVAKRPILTPQKSPNNFYQNCFQEFVAIKIYYKEIDYRTRVKQAGGVWSQQMKMWVIKKEIVERLGLLERIVEGGIDMCTDVDTSLIK